MIPPLKRGGVKCMAGLDLGKSGIRSFCRKSRRKCVVELDLRGGVRFSAKEDLRGGVKICVVGLKSTFNFLHLIDCVLGWFRSCLTTTRV